MSQSVLYSIIGGMFSMLLLLITFVWRSNIKREDEKDKRLILRDDKLVISLDNLAISLTKFKQDNFLEHARIESVLVDKTNALDKKITKLEAAQGNALCPVVTKQQVV